MLMAALISNLSGTCDRICVNFKLMDWYSALSITYIKRGYLKHAQAKRHNKRQRKAKHYYTSLFTTGAQMRNIFNCVAIFS